MPKYRTLTILLIICLALGGWSPASAEEELRPFILLPIAYYTPETSLAYGALGIINLQKVADGRTSNVVTSASYTVKQQTIFTLQPKLYFLNGQFDLSIGLRYLFFPSEFYGRGNDVKDSDRQNFTLNSLSSDFFARYFAWRHFFIGTGGGHFKISVVDLHEGDSLRPELQAGFGEYELKSLSLGIGWDRRDHQNAPLDRKSVV